MTRRFLLAFAATAFALTAARADEVLVQRVYSVADLVVALPDPISPHVVPAMPAAAQPCPAGACPDLCRATPVPVAPKTMHKELLQLIVNTVAPDTWTTVGGQGTIEFHAIGLAFVVRQKPAVHEQIVDLLDALRRLQDRQIAFDVRLLSVSDACYEALGRPGTADGVSLLTPEDARALLEKAQGDHRTNVMQAPRLTAMDGQDATIRVEDQKMFVVGVDQREVQGQTVFIPRQESLSAGVTMTLRGNILPDRKAISVRLKADVTDVQGEGALFPISTFITPVFEGGAKGKPIPFTQFIQQPTQTTCGITKMMAIPAGRTAVFCAGRRSREVAEQAKVPVLGDLPLLGEFFTAKTRRTETDNLVVLLTPRVIVLAGGEEAEAPPAKPVDQVQLDMKVFSVCDCFWKQGGAPFASLTNDALAFIDLKGDSFDKALSECDGCKVYSRPQVMTLAGLTASFATDDRLTLGFTPKVSADRQYVRLEGTVWGLEAAAGTPVLPTVGVAHGKAVIYRLGRCPASGETVYALVSPKWTGGEESAARQVQLAELLTEYRKACADERTDDARTLAQRCLKIDPTCFGR